MAEWTRWAFIHVPTTLRLSGIEELHFQAHEWEVPQALLPRLAAYMPAVTTLVIKHRYNENMENHMEMARTVVRILESDDPVLFPDLAHLELIARNVPQAFRELLSRATRTGSGCGCAASASTTSTSSVGR